MFNTWLILRQAQEALKNGRLDEAGRLAQQPEVQGHRRAGEVLQQVAQAYLKRAQQHAKHEDYPAAWKDLVGAEEAGFQDSAVMKLRQELAQRGMIEIKELLRTGEPARAAELGRMLRERHVQQPELRVLDEVAQGWSVAQDLAARGDFAQALAMLDRVHRLAPETYKHLDELRGEVKRRRPEFESVQMKLHDALKQANWREVIGLADEVLAIAPQHAEARKVRAKAWRAVEPPTLPYAENAASKKEEPPKSEEARRMLLWIDGVGGYLVCLSPRVSFGQATADAYVDIPIYADISRLHGYLTRDAEGYLLEAVRKVTLNQQPVDKALLKDGDRLTVGNSCQLHFKQPVAISQTARLEVASGHRLPLTVDGVLLMADTCVLGPAGNSHIAVPELPRPVVIFRTKEGLGDRLGDRLGVRVAGEFTVDGHKFQNRATLGQHSTVAGDDFRFTLEPLGARIGMARV